MHRPFSKAWRGPDYSHCAYSHRAAGYTISYSTDLSHAAIKTEPMLPTVSNVML